MTLTSLTNMEQQENDKQPDNTSSPVPNPNGFEDPYTSLRKADKTRTTIDISSAARADISAVYPKKGVLQTTINILIEKLRNELKRAGLTSYSPEEFERAIAQSTICLGGFQYHLRSPTGRPSLVLPDGPSHVSGGTTTRRVARGRKPRGAVETPD